MTLPVSIPNTFANATTSIPLANLDANFTTIYAAVNGIGNGSETLANVQVSGGTLSNVTLANVQVSGGTLSNVTLDNVTVDVETLSNVTLVDVTVTSGNATFTTANATTIDTTNIEVTNIKAKDGTASVSIADTTGIPTISKATVIETTDNTNAALRITQLGTGNALLVEDSANPDATPFVIDNAGNVGIGTIPQTFFNVYNATNNVFHLDGDGTTIFRPNRFSTDTSGAQINFRKARGTRASPSAVNTGDTSGLLGFAVYAGTNYRNVAQIQAICSTYTSDTNVEGALIFATNGGSTFVTERMRITSDGYLRMASGTGGIQFNGDTAAANALDDYEEGTWTPAVTFGGNAVGVTYGTQSGRYVKVGNAVTVYCVLALTSKGSSSGDAVITGLPFAAIEGSAATLTAYNVGNSGYIWGQQSVGTTLALYTVSTAGTRASITNTNFSNDTNINFSVTYIV